MNILTPLPYGDALFSAFFGARAQLLNIERNGDDWGVQVAWEHRAQGDMTSPVLVHDHAYLFLRSNRFACVPMDGGDGGYISEPTGDEYMSLIAHGNRILALGNSGILRMIRATPERYEVIGEVQLVDGKTWAHLAAAGQQLFIREENSLHAFTWK